MTRHVYARKEVLQDHILTTVLGLQIARLLFVNCKKRPRYAVLFSQQLATQVQKTKVRSLLQEGL